MSDTDEVYSGEDDAYDSEGPYESEGGYEEPFDGLEGCGSECFRSSSRSGSDDSSWGRVSSVDAYAYDYDYYEDFFGRRDEPEEVQCKGITKRGTVCRITSRNDMEEADPLRRGEKYCAFHRFQQQAPVSTEVVRCRGITQRGTACRITSASDVAEATSLRAGGKFCDHHRHQRDMFDDSRGAVVYGAVASEQQCRGPGTPCFEGGAYGLAAAVWPERPTVPHDYHLPPWAVRAACQDASLRHCIRSFSAFVVHQVSKSVVGVMEGQLLRRVPDLSMQCDKHSTALSTTVRTAFACNLHREVVLRPELTFGSIWGEALDSGNILVIERLELVTEHRGKRALEHISAPLSTVCRELGAPCAVARARFLSAGDLIASTGHVAREIQATHRSVQKLRDSFASMGFRRVGITDYMAMVLDPSHACWQASSHKPPEFPFREVAKTVNNPAFRPLVQRGVAAEWFGRVDLPDLVKASVLALQAVDALLAHDPVVLFEVADPTFGSPAKFLHDALSRQRGVWDLDKQLSPGIRDLISKLAAMGPPIRR